MKVSRFLFLSHVNENTEEVDYVRRELLSRWKSFSGVQIATLKEKMTILLAGKGISVFPEGIIQLKTG